MRQSEINSGDRLFDSHGYYFGQVRNGIAFRGDYLHVSMAGPWEPFRPDTVPDVTIERMTIFSSDIPGVWVVNHNFDIEDRRQRERLEFTLHDQFSLMV